MTGTTMIVLIVFISVGFGVMYDMYKKHRVQRKNF